MNVDIVDAQLSATAELCSKTASVTLIDWFLSEADPDTYYRKNTISEQSGVDHESVRKQLGSGGVGGLLDICGVVEVSDRDAQMPRYRLAKTAVTDQLQTLREQGYSASDLRDFFATAARRKLTEFILIWADPTATYTRSGMEKTLNISFKTVNENIDAYIEAEVIEAEETGHSIEYTVNKNSDLRAELLVLGNAALNCLSAS
jgi:hypothetical protein